MNYDAMVRWEEPRLGFNSRGEEVTVPVEVQVTVRDAIKMARRGDYKGSDEKLLEEFMAIRCAWIVKDSI